MLKSLFVNAHPWRGKLEEVRLVLIGCTEKRSDFFSQVSSGQGTFLWLKNILRKFE